jgi:hypothetical protein
MPSDDSLASHKKKRRWWLIAPAAALAGALLGGWWSDARESERAAENASVSAPAAAAAAASAATTTTSNAAAAPFSAAGLAARQAQLAQWQERLDRAQQALEAYRRSTRYPHGSRPAAEQPDQMRPNDPIVEEHALKEPGKKTAADGVRLRTSQERVYAQASERVRFTVALVDAQGQTLPLRVLSASLREFTPPTVASLFPTTPAVFNDDGTQGDALAGDRVFSTTVQPSAQGFAGLAGQLRLEAFLDYKGERGFIYFDLYVTPESPAAWRGAPREAVEAGSLVFVLPIEVRESGRYVVTGRVDDANGQPFALLTFNDVLPGGAGEVRLALFGKLIADALPAFPLTLRDVEAFRLREEGHPDRALMPRLPGTLLVSARHALDRFSAAEWSSEERDRYLAELTRDADDARREVERLKKGP